MKAAKRRSSSNLALMALLGLVILGTIVPTLALWLAVTSTLHEAPDDAMLLVTIFESIIAAIGMLLVVFQLRRDDEGDERGRIIEQHRFLFEYNKAFIENPEMTNVEAQLERYDQAIKEGKQYALINDENRQSFINYLVYLEGLAPLILDGLMELWTIDNLMAYRFYLAVNNPELQKDQLFEYPEYYLGCFKLYEVWTAYRKERNLEILHEDRSALSSWEEYKQWLSVSDRARRRDEQHD